MKKYLLIQVLFLLSFTTYSQSLSNKFGAINTNFVITSDSFPIEVKRQFIIERGFYDYSSFSDGAYGFGLQSNYLELELSESIVKKPKDKRNWGNHYMINFFDSCGTKLHEKKTYKRYSQYIKQHSFENSNRHFVVINLIEIPIIILESTVNIDITEYYYQKESK